MTLICDAACGRTMEIQTHQEAIARGWTRITARRRDRTEVVWLCPSESLAREQQIREGYQGRQFIVTREGTIREG